MLISPVDPKLAEWSRKSPFGKSPSDKDDFARMLDASAEKGKSTGATPEKVAMAAEILRLDMMRSAVSIAGNISEPASPSIGNTLKTYLTNSVDPSQKTDTNLLENSVQEVVNIPQDNFPAPTVTENSPVSTQSPTSFDPIIRSASRRYGVDEGLIKAVIRMESDFNPRAVSRAGARGLMQLMPGTAAGLGVKDSFDPEQNIMAGTRFLRDMLDRYNGDVDSALAAYNWGPGNLDRSHGAFLPRETREYLVKVKKYYAQYVG